jgi:hypothetical protein
MPAAAAMALFRPLLTGPCERALAIRQIAFAASLRDRLSDHDRQMVTEKVRWIESLERGDLWVLARRDPQAATLVIQSLVREDMRIFTRFVASIYKT